MIQYRLWASVQYGMWAWSMKLAVKKPKCWSNAMLPIMFIKKMNKARGNMIGKWIYKHFSLVSLSRLHTALQQLSPCSKRGREWSCKCQRTWVLWQHDQQVVNCSRCTRPSVVEWTQCTTELYYSTIIRAAVRFVPIDLNVLNSLLHFLSPLFRHLMPP